MKIINYLKNNIWLSSIAVFGLFFAIYGSIYFFVDGISTVDDHFFHIKLAYLLRTEGFDVIENFDYSPIEKYSRYPLSLFNIFLIPFTFFKDLFTGLRVADTFIAGLSMAVIYFALRKFKFKYAFLILLALVSATYFSSRIFYGRAYVLTFGLILLELYFAQKKEHFKFFGIALFHVLWHQNSFFFPIAVFFAVEAGRYLGEKKIYLKNFLAVVASVFLGMSFFPDFPKNIFTWFSEIVNLSSKVSVGLKLEGSELYVKNIFQILGSNQVFFLLAVVSIVLTVYLYIQYKKEEELFDYRQKEKLTEIFSFFLILIVFVLGAIKISGRFFDYYFILTAILFVSILMLIVNRKDIIIKEKILKYGVIACFIFLSYLTLNNFLDMRINIANSDYKTIKAPSEWIRNNSKEKEMIYLLNWSDFPLAFFYNDKNIYSWGMEPRDLSFKSDKLYWKAYNILAYGYYCEKQEDCEGDVKLIEERMKQLGQEDKDKARKENSRKIINAIKNDFGSRFILSTNSGFSELIKLNEDLIEDKFEATSEKNKNYKITAFKLK